MKLNKENLLKGPLFDKFLITHIYSGIVTFGILSKFNLSNKQKIIIGLIIHTIYEIKDFLTNYNLINNTFIYKNLRFLFGSPPNTLINSIGDTIGFVIGFFIYIFMLKNPSNLELTLYGIIAYIVIFLNEIKKLI
jgi:hypothetical protein